MNYSPDTILTVQTICLFYIAYIVYLLHTKENLPEYGVKLLFIIVVVLSLTNFYWYKQFDDTPKPVLRSTKVRGIRRK